MSCCKTFRELYSQRLPGWWICVCWSNWTAPLRTAPSWAVQTPQSESKAQCSSSGPSGLSLSLLWPLSFSLWLHDTHSMVKLQLSFQPCRKVERVNAATYCCKEIMPVYVTIALQPLQCSRLGVWGDSTLESNLHILSDQVWQPGRNPAHSLLTHYSSLFTRGRNQLVGMFFAPTPLLGQMLRKH